jgi:hypothetical protein
MAFAKAFSDLVAPDVLRMLEEKKGNIIITS